MDKIAFTLPNGKAVVAPSAIPANLQGGFADSGHAFIQLIINSFFLLIVVSTLILILVAGIRWIVSGGDVNVVKSARRQLIYAIIGLLVASMAFFLIKTVINVLGGSSSFWNLP